MIYSYGVKIPLYLYHQVKSNSLDVGVKMDIIVTSDMYNYSCNNDLKGISIVFSAECKKVSNGKNCSWYYSLVKNGKVLAASIHSKDRIGNHCYYDGNDIQLTIYVDSSK